MIDRRSFVSGLAAGILAAPLAADAQPRGKTVRIGVLYPGSDNSIFRGNFDGFRQALAAAGYVEGRNLAFEPRFGDGHELAPLAAELTTLRLDLIQAVARPGVMAMQAATSTIPVVALDLASPARRRSISRKSRCPSRAATTWLRPEDHSVSSYEPRSPPATLVKTQRTFHLPPTLGGGGGAQGEARAWRTICWSSARSNGLRRTGRPVSVRKRCSSEDPTLPVRKMILGTGWPCPSVSAR